MNLPIPAELLVTGIISAVAAMTLLKVLQRDVNGLGSRLRQEERIAIEERYKHGILLVASCEDSKLRHWLAEQLLKD